MNYSVQLGKSCVAVALAVAGALSGGCGSPPKVDGPAARAFTAAPAPGVEQAPGVAPAPAQVLGVDFGSPADGGGGPSRPPDGAPRARVRVVQLEIYRLVVPLGAVSRSEEFWKHIDEQRVDVGTYDLLRKNGWRLGTAPSTEWAYFRDILDAYPASSKPYTLAAAEAGGGSHLQLPMKQGVAYQNIFYFTDENLLNGRTFERCDNLLNISLQQAPRKAGEARVTVCPTVRSLRRRFEVSTTEGQREIRYAHPERLYDLNLQADIPAGDFLVIAPSPEVRWRTSLGAAFLIEDGAAEQVEHMLLLVPRLATLEETAKTGVPAATPAE